MSTTIAMPTMLAHGSLTLDLGAEEDVPRPTADGADVLRALAARSGGTTSDEER